MAIRVFTGESSLLQWDKHGTPITSKTRDFGVCQVNEKVWDHVAKDMGLDYKYDVYDQMEMCRHIYDEAGGQWTPWVYYLTYVSR